MQDRQGRESRSGVCRTNRNRSEFLRGAGCSTHTNPRHLAGIQSGFFFTGDSAWRSRTVQRVEERLGVSLSRSGKAKRLLEVETSPKQGNLPPVATFREAAWRADTQGPGRRTTYPSGTRAACRTIRPSEYEASRWRQSDRPSLSPSPLRIGRQIRVQASTPRGENNLSAYPPRLSAMRNSGGFLLRCDYIERREGDN